MENSIKVPQKIKNRTTIRSSNSASGYLFKENKNTNIKRYMHHDRPTPSSRAKIWKQPKYPSVDEWIKKLW